VSRALCAKCVTTAFERRSHQVPHIHAFAADAGFAGVRRLAVREKTKTAESRKTFGG
jgi:hypothetical protein